MAFLRLRSCGRILRGAIGPVPWLVACWIHQRYRHEAVARLTSRTATWAHKEEAKGQLHGNMERSRQSFSFKEDSASWNYLPLR